MARWMLTAALSVTLAGLSQAQNEGQVLTIKTAGQPDRRVQILKTEKLPDGRVLQEVRDLATGTVFTLTDSKALPTGTPASMAGATLPGTQVPAGNLPQAKPRSVDPLLGGKAMPPVMSNSAPVKPEYPNLMGKLRGSKEAEPAMQFSGPVTTPSAAPTAASKQSGLSKALFGSYDDPANQPTTLVGGRPQLPLKTAPVSTTQTPTPTLTAKLFGDKPQPIQAPVQTAPTATTGMAKSNVIRPNAVAPSAPPVGPAMQSKLVVAPPPVVAAVPVMAPAPAIKQVEALEPQKSDPREPNFPVPSMKSMSMKQIEEMVKELRTNARPTNRLEAANALAASPMAGMIEVRQILAEASYRDPVPVVRAHCIELLTKMNYDEFNYRKYVESLVNDEEPAVQRAARAACR